MEKHWEHRSGEAFRALRMCEKLRRHHRWGRDVDVNGQHTLPSVKEKASWVQHSRGGRVMSFDSPEAQRAAEVMSALGWVLQGPFLVVNNPLTLPLLGWG